MKSGRQKFTAIFVAVGLYFYSQTTTAVLFEPGVGVGLEYSDNLTLVSDNQQSGSTTIGYLGGRVEESEGALKYDVSALLNKVKYTEETYPDKQYLTLGAIAHWAMLKNRFNWYLRNYFNQRTVNALNSNTPDNLQDSNNFTFGANINLPLSRRQTFTINPSFNQNYYQASPTNNQRYSLFTSWEYLLSPLDTIGINLSVSKVAYTQKNLLGLSIEDTTYTNMALVMNGKRQYFLYTVNLGTTRVERDNGDETQGFAGYLLWRVDVSSRSQFETLVSSNLTNTSNRDALSISTINDPTKEGNDGVQITSDVIRNSIINLAYLRKDASLRTRISARYNKVTYSDNPLDRVIQDYRLRFNYPVTQLLSGGAYTNYFRTKQLDTGRIDNGVTVGGNLNYIFTRKLRGFVDLAYRKKNSTFSPENYQEYSVFGSIVYGFGNVYRPTNGGSN